MTVNDLWFAARLFAASVLVAVIYFLTDIIALVLRVWRAARE